MEVRLRRGVRPGYWAATAYVGDYFEWTTGGAAPVTYYYAGGQRVALRQGADPLYLLGDHIINSTCASNVLTVGNFNY